jgi:hypothetical protein
MREPKYESHGEVTLIVREGFKTAAVSVAVGLGAILMLARVLKEPAIRGRTRLRLYTCSLAA